MSKGKTVEESIRIQAYLLSEKEGHPAGMERFFWRQAEALVAAKLKAKKSKTKGNAKAKAKIPVVIEAPKAKASPKAAKSAKPAKPVKSSRKKKDPSPA